uniref:Uncharacterized protein n=1 Tax=Setaria viridis TaxID=4556 RepID=A0A4U6TZE4_SETVI|nr:hypothetical protein SEVIR_6G027350v2 [Setaria viridis]
MSPSHRLLLLSRRGGGLSIRPLLLPPLSRRLLLLRRGLRIHGLGASFFSATASVSTAVVLLDALVLFGVGGKEVQCRAAAVTARGRAGRCRVEEEEWGHGRHGVGLACCHQRRQRQRRLKNRRKGENNLEVPAVRASTSCKEPCGGPDLLGFMSGLLDLSSSRFNF